MLIMSVSGRLLFVSYDVVRNIPSGRKLSVTQPGFDVYEITPGTQGEPDIVAAGVDLGGGLDSIVYGRVQEEKITLCAEKQCADIKPGGKVNHWSVDELEGYEFVEVAFDADSAYALVRKQWDDRVDGNLTADDARLSLVRLSPDKADLEPITTNGTPYELVVNDKKPSWKVASSAEELSDLLLYEFSRMPNGGGISFGDNNLEGRVAWNQVYYLNGLISLAQGDLGVSSPGLVEYARRRVRAEVDLIARLADSDYPGYRVKRYSLDREPLLFSLHLGRIASLLERTEQAGLGTPAVKNALASIKKELLSFEHTVEHPIGCQLVVGEICRTLAYRQGYPFWADGVNVPYNYVSGYVGGLLAVSNDAASVDYAAELMVPLLVQEKFSELPKTWRYWGFEGQKGWGYSNGKSLNTSDWVGNQAGLDIAHITYRSMDATTLLILNIHRPDVVNAETVVHIKKLVSAGMLLPSVNEFFYQTDSVATLDSVVSARYSRSTQAWQIQSQIWALSDLAKNNE
ncbi:hypothetical protein D16iCDA_20715 [Pseudomonas seleniipraecipitans]|uniref:Uncharacterized protein n=1 Tax=Phytopseudomonas seleniipraecipitans TaxID=640205 RepID=A0ABY5J7Q1_9GAMM|nr:hypothetical protein [Pseudomonas seleniipraecipitans]UUD64065.1 hypothetical protein D16iCDA_20715 [Pseudomonas seleniipraecipitans]